MLQPRYLPVRVRYGLRLAVLAAALGLWQGLSAAGVIRSDEFPSMSQTAAALWGLASASTLWSAVGETMEGWAIGLAIGVAAALAIGTLIALNGFAYRSAIGVIEFFKAIPVIAILPVGLVLWGATLTMKFALVAFAVFWPLVIQVCYGVRSLDPAVRDTATVLRVRGPRKFLVVILPSAAPFIATGLRVAVAVALIVDIIAELIGGGSGIGERILVAENAGPAAYPQMYAYIVAAGVLGVLLASAFTVAERYVLHWHESQRAGRAEGASLGYPERRGRPLSARYLRGLRLAGRGATRAWLFVVMFAVWWLWSAGSKSPYFPPLSSILKSLWTQWATGSARVQLASSLEHMLAGYAIAGLIGIGVGALLWSQRYLRDATSPYLYFLYVLPAPVLVPAAMTLFGIGFTMKVVLIAFAAVWPTLLNTLDGMRAVDQVKLDTSRVLGVSPLGACPAWCCPRPRRRSSPGCATPSRSPSSSWW